MAPAMAQMHGIEILKISASNFWKHNDKLLQHVQIPSNVLKSKTDCAVTPPCVLAIQRFPKTVCGSDAALLLMPLQSWPNH